MYEEIETMEKQDAIALASSKSPIAKETLWALSCHEACVVRQTLARRSDLPFGLVKKLLDDKGKTTRRIMLNNKHYQIKKRIKYIITNQNHEKTT